MIHPDHLLHYSLFTINSHDLNQSSSVSVETYRPYVKFQERGHDRGIEPWIVSFRVICLWRHIWIGILAIRHILLAGCSAGSRSSDCGRKLLT